MNSFPKCDDTEGTFSPEIFDFSCSDERSNKLQIENDDASDSIQNSLQDIKQSPLLSEENKQKHAAHKESELRVQSRSSETLMCGLEDSGKTACTPQNQGSMQNLLENFQEDFSAPPRFLNLSKRISIFNVWNEHHTNEIPQPRRKLKSLNFGSDNHTASSVQPKSWTEAAPLSYFRHTSEETASNYQIQDEKKLQMSLSKEEGLPDTDTLRQGKIPIQLKPSKLLPSTFPTGFCHFCQDAHIAQYLPVCSAWLPSAQSEGMKDDIQYDGNQAKACVDLASLAQQKIFLESRIESLEKENESLRLHLSDAHSSLEEKSSQRQKSKSGPSLAKLYARRKAQVSPHHQRRISSTVEHSFFSSPEHAQSTAKQRHEEREGGNRGRMLESFQEKLRAKLELIRRRRMARKRWIIQPFSFPKMVYDIFMALLVCYSVITVPVQLAFGGTETHTYQILNIWIDSIFLFDMFINFNTAYEDRGQLVCDRMSIAKKYVKGLFLVDLMGSFPFFLLAGLFSSSSNFVILKLVRLLRVLRMLRLALIRTKMVHLSRLALKLKDSGLALPFQADSAVMNLISRALKILFAAHLMACAWHSLNSCDQEFDDWVRCGYNTSPGSRYLASLYFTIQTMMTVGYGDVAVNTDAQRAFAMVIQLSGPLIVGVIVSSIGELVDSFDLRSKYMAERMSSLKHYMSEKHFPAHLNNKLYKHFTYVYSNTTVFQEDAIVQSLPVSVHQKLILHQHHKHLESLPFFNHYLNKGCTSFVLDTLQLLKPMFVQSGQDIALQDDPAEDVYFIKKGQLNGLLMGSCLGPVLVGVFRQGSMVNMATVVHNLDMFYTIRAACSSDILWIHKEELQAVIAKHPEVGDLIKITADDEMHHIHEVLQCPTTSATHFVSKDLVFCEPSDGGTQKLWPAAQVQVDSLEEAFSGSSKRTIRTIRLTKTMLKWASRFDVFCGKKISLENLSKFEDNIIEREETTESLWQQRLIDPGSQWYKNWNLCALILTVYQVVCVPVSIGFNVEGIALSLIDGLVDCFYLMDIVINFRKLDQAAPLFYFADPIIIALRYLRGWFFVDLISCLPLDSVLLITNMDYPAVSNKLSEHGFAKICNFMRFLKLLRIFKLAYLTDLTSNELGPYTYILNQLLILFAILLYVGHFFGCFWGLLALLNRGGLDASWMGPIIAGDLPLTEAGITNQYTASVYWAFTTITTVGYGDITPTTDYERLYCIIVMVFGAAMLSFIVDNVSKLVYQLSHMKQQNKKKVSEINEYAKEQSLGYSLSNSIKKHIQFAFSTHTSHVESSILNLLPCELRRETLLYSYQEIIGIIPIFRDAPRSFISILLKKMAVQFNEAKSTIYTVDEGSKGLYFLIRGVVEELKKQPQANAKDKLFGIVEKGGYFGHRRFVKGIKVKFGARALTDVHIFVLHSQEIKKYGRVLSFDSKSLEGLLSEKK